MSFAEKEVLEFRYGVKIFTLGATELQVRCSEVTKDAILSDTHIHKARDDAHIALRNFRSIEGFGRAIAAPQVGHLIRMIAMNLDGKELTLYNPVISYQSEETMTMWDDCLSFPDLMCCVHRSKKISIEFLDSNGETVTWTELDPALSELLQHEIDHLDGVLAVSKAVKPPKVGADGFSCEAVVSRADWLADRPKYNQLVDFHY